MSIMPCTATHALLSPTAGYAGLGPSLDADQADHGPPGAGVAQSGPRRSRGREGPANQG